VSALNTLFKTHGKDVEFFVVYIREAHPSDSRRPDPVLDVKQPTTFGERLGVATTCRQDLGLKLPMLVDGIENTTEAAYSGWPDRLFLVDTKGVVAFRGGRGPRGFKPAQLEAAIKTALGNPTVAKKAYTDAELEGIRERLRKRRKASLDKNKE
jgi:hypothetical protein